ncbi:MAG: RidA family protein [Candidatus Obscuribacterales bacterium]|nr:RidA family protein [Candidatus Obscuribacterales bacterium]
MQLVSTESAPKAIGPYSQAIKANGMVFVSGQIPLDPASGQLISGSIATQVKQVIANLSAILKASGSDLSKVVKTTVYLKDMKDFDEMNQTYAEYFTETKPARATIQAAGLPKNVAVEIDAIALAN